MPRNTRHLKRAAVTTVNDALDVYAREHVASDAVVDNGRLHTAVEWLRAGLGGVRVDQLSPGDVNCYASRRMGGHSRKLGRVYETGTVLSVSSGTVRRELNVLIAALNYCARRRLIEHVPYVPMPPRPPAKDTWLTETEATNLLAYADQLSVRAGYFTRAHRFALFALATASRKHAIETLTWDLIDLEARLIRFDKLPGQRTKKRRAPAPIPTWAYDWILKMLFDCNRRGFETYVLDHPGPVYYELKSLCRYAASASGNEKYLRVTPHVLRHTRATHMARAGRDMWEIAGLLGDSVKTVTENYLHHCPDHLRAAADSVSYSTPTDDQGVLS